jgi:predicted negative regulator of RcsB-dependent stress response
MGGLAAWNGYQFWQGRQAQQAAALAEAVEAAAQSGDLVRVEQAFGDLKSGYAGTAQAGQAGLVAAKALADAGKWDAAKPVLAWVAEKAADEGYRALGKLRLAGVLVEEKAYDDALAQLSGSFPVEFAAMVADRKGDVLALQDKKPEAVAEYRRAYQALDERAEYRRLVEAKLNALGARVDAASAAQPGSAA